MELSKIKVGAIGSESVYSYRLSNSKGLTLVLLSYGATAMELWAPDQDGKRENILLSVTDWEDYRKYRPFYGSAVGPVAGRIAGGRFVLEDRTVDVEKNEGENHLHGGSKGWDTQVWHAETSLNEEEAAVQFSLPVKEGAGEYPGKVQTQIRYTLTDANEWKIEYTATTDQPTLLNPTNHVYFNLSGNNRSIRDQFLFVDSSRVLELGEGNIPTGKLLDVTGTSFDFRERKKISEALGSTHPQIKLANGLDHAFLVDSHKNGPIAALEDLVSGRSLEVTSDRPSVVIYTHNHAFPERGISPYSGIAFETQAIPNAIHFPSFKESVILRPNETFQSKTVFTLR